MSKQRELPPINLDINSVFINPARPNQKDTDVCMSINDRTCVREPGCATGPGECR